MFILQSSDYNIEEAKHQLAKRRIKKEPWNEEDTAIFKQALQTYGKHFNKIKQLLPHKSIKEIINFYYDNKKKLNFRSIIDAYLEEHNPESSSEDGDIDAIEKQSTRCYNCGQILNLRQMGDIKLCNPCFIHFRNYHRHRLCLKTMNFVVNANAEETIKCSKGIAEVVERFVEFATEEEVTAQSSSSSMKGVTEVDDDDLQIVSIIRPPEMRYIRILKQLEREEMLARGNCVRLEHILRIQFEKELNENLERYRISRLPSATSGRPRRSPSWSYKEKWQALFAFQRYGKDFDTIAEVLESKTPDMVKAFYYEMREQIDDMISKTSEYYRRLSETYDFKRKVEVDTSNEIIDIE
ncbi:Uncharacterized protein BM_BM10500 [Brugia malayi]|nr:Uncharacterized protein BM_BM10500 [Brugia malayi]VIO99045.1 Uncharacterized protein BM_BM10500 [Brugia malayi]